MTLMMITCSAHARDGESDFGEYDDIADDYELLMMMMLMMIIVKLTMTTCI